MSVRDRPEMHETFVVHVDSDLIVITPQNVFSDEMVETTNRQAGIYAVTLSGLKLSRKFQIDHEGNFTDIGDG